MEQLDTLYTGSNVEEKDEQQDGWAKVSGGRSYHYFVAGKALCGRVTDAGLSRIRDPDEDKRCTRCAPRVKRLLPQ